MVLFILTYNVIYFEFWLYWVWEASEKVSGNLGAW